MEVPPGGVGTVEYEVLVPAGEPPIGEPLVGTYWSLIMIEELPPRGATDDAGVALGDMQTGVKQVLRYAVQLVSHIGDTGSHGIRFVDRALLLNDDGTRVLQVDVENTGERSLRPTLWVELHDSSGARHGRFECERRRLYPGTSVRYTVDLSSAASGAYQALVVVDNGDEHVFGAQYGLEF